MGMLDGLLSQISENVDVQNLAQKVGLSGEQVEAAIAALGKAHPEPGDTAASAAAQTGLPVDTLQQVIAHIGGEGALGRFASLLNEQGGVENLLGSVTGLFSKS